MVLKKTVLTLLNYYIYTSLALHYNEEKASEGDIDESNIIDGRYFPAARPFIRHHLVFDRRPCGRCRGMAAGQRHRICGDRQGSSVRPDVHLNESKIT